MLLVVGLCYNTVKRNIVQPCETSYNGLEGSSPPHPALKGGVNFEPVISESKSKIILSQLTYKVTSYVNFTPYLNSIRKFYHLLEAFESDMQNPL